MNTRKKFNFEMSINSSYYNDQNFYNFIIFNSSALNVILLSYRIPTNFLI